MNEYKNYKKKIFCCNCGKFGHKYSKCNEPITSLGIIAIRSINNDQNNKLLEYFDIVNICIENCNTLEKFEHTGQEIEINYKIMEKYPAFLKIIEDLYVNYKETYKNYIYDGSEMTIGEIINHYYPEIPDNNWMKFICNVDRTSQITKGLCQLTKKIKDDYSINKKKI